VGLVEKFILRICQILKNVWKMHLFLCNRVERFCGIWERKKEFFVKFFCFLSILLRKRRRSLIPDLFIETAGANHDFSDLVRIAVGRRTTIFQVSTLLLSNIARNTDRGSPIGNTGREIMNGRSLMQAS